MANAPAAKKDIRQTKKRTVRNLAKKKKIKEMIKASLAAIESKSDDAPKLIQETYKALDKAAKTNTIHANKAARMKSRIQKQLNAKS